MKSLPFCIPEAWKKYSFRAEGSPGSDSSHFRFFRSGSVRSIDGSSSQFVHSLECGRGWCITWKRPTVFAGDGRDCTQILALDHIPAGNPNRGVKSECKSFQPPFVLSCFGLDRPVQTLCSDLLLTKCTQIPDHLKTASRRNALHWCSRRGGSGASFAGCSDICWQ